MATDYYRMGADLGGAYFDGREEGRLRARREELDRQRAELHDMQMQGLRRQRGLEREQDAAFGAHTDLSSNGMVQAEGTGLSQPSAQFVASGNAGLGVGEQAVQDTASMYQREMSRFAGAANPPAQGLPKYDGTAPVSRRGATDVELEQSLGRISAAQRDARGMRESNESVKKLKLKDEDAAFMKQALADLRDPATFIEKYGAGMNKNGNVDGFVTFDPKTKQFVVASKAGVESMDEVDMLAHVVAARELGRGNVQAGLEMMTKNSDRADAKLDKKWTRAMELAKVNMELYFGGRRADNDDKRTAAYGTSVGAAETRAAAAHREVPKEISDRMMAIELKVRDPNTPPEERARLREEFDMLRVRATYALGNTTNLGRSGLDQKALSDVAAKLAADRGIPYAEAWDQVVAVHGGGDVVGDAVADAKRLNGGEKGPGGQGLRPPTPAPESRIPPSPGQQRAQQQGLVREARQQERSMEQDDLATTWDRVAPTIDLGRLDPAMAREILTRFGAVMSPRERMDNNRRAN